MLFALLQQWVENSVEWVLHMISDTDKEQNDTTGAENAKLMKTGDPNHEGQMDKPQSE